MKKTIICLSCLVMGLAPCFAGTLDISGRAGVFNASGADSSSMMYGLAAEYGLTENISIRGAVETTTYTVNDVTTTYMPVSLDIIYSQPLGGGLRPYAGVGLSYNSTSVGGDTTQTAGAQAETGIRYDFGGLSAGIEFRYMIPDLNDTSNTATTYNAYATGGFSQSFNL